MSKKITVYSKPDCMQCAFTKKFLDERGIKYISKDVYKDAMALQYVKDLGLQSLPVVEIDGQAPFYGFRPELLGEILTAP